ncbi:MAG: hypothetical protein A2X94_00480 [Bdellovibrionales bacterium GWB1_55_8]|nr:MAG: hypothetical protein A2X94_00480 [Bdellovibrionales bacterium GWB1_55_8]
MKPASKLLLSLTLLAVFPYPLHARELPPFKIGLSTQVVGAGFELRPLSPDSRSTILKFRPAQSNYAGIILGYRWIAGTFSFGIPANPEVRDVEGVSHYRDYRLAYWGNRLGIEGAYSWYRGYLIENSDALSAATLGGNVFYKLPDVETLGYGVTVVKAVGLSSNYSMAAAMDQSAIQEKSGGSPLVLATWRRQSIKSPAALIPLENRVSFGADQDIALADTISIAAGAGYAYNWVPGIFFVSPLIALTLGYQQVEYELAGQAKAHASAGANIHARISLGMNFVNGFLAARFIFDRFGQQTESIEVGNNIYGFSISAGTRF